MSGDYDGEVEEITKVSEMKFVKKDLKPEEFAPS
jgi:hypothetical protein